MSNIENEKGNKIEYVEKGSSGEMMPNIEGREGDIMAIQNKIVFGKVLKFFGGDKKQTIEWLGNNSSVLREMIVKEMQEDGNKSNDEIAEIVFKQLDLK